MYIGSYGDEEFAPITSELIKAIERRDFEKVDLERFIRVGKAKQP